MAVIALLEREIVAKRRLLTTKEFVHGAGLGQFLGSFAVNSSFFVGYQLQGVAGGFLSAFAFLAPSVALVIGLSYVYFRFNSIPALQGAVAGLGPAVIALILSAAWIIGRGVIRTRAAVAIAVAALVAGVAKINPAIILLAAAGAGLVLPGPPGLGGDKGAHQNTYPGVGFLAMAPLAVAPVAGIWAVTLEFLRIGIVFFGGGYSLLPLLHERLVTSLRWLTAREFLDGVAVSNLTPGPLAVVATFAGYHMAGAAGAIAATAALFTPGLLVTFALTREYGKRRSDPRIQRLLAGVNPAVVGLVLSAAVALGPPAMASWRGWAASALFLYLMSVLRWPPVALLAIGAAAGYLGWLP
jgi:chromate transporter